MSAMREALERALNEGRNVLPDATDDQAAVIEAWAKSALDTSSDDDLLVSAFRKLLSDEDVYVIAMRQELLDVETELPAVVFSLLVDGRIENLSEAELAAVQVIRS